MLDRFKVPDDIAVRVKQEDMRHVVEGIFESQEMSTSAAAAAADVLMYADIRGIDSHGVSNMMRAYVAGFRAGQINPKPNLTRTLDHVAALNFDCDRGLGLAQSREMMLAACERARETGVAVATAFNGRHYGACAYYAHVGLDEEMVGISMTAGGLLVAPTQGAERMLGLNPLGIGAPAGDEVPFIFDASMSSVAGNKIELLRRVGGHVLPGWVTDADGSPVMDETQVPQDFMMLPLGGTREIGSHKGFGLSFMIEILCGMLQGTGGGPHRRKGVAHYFMAIDVARFTDLELFKKDMDDYLRSILDCKPAPGESRVVYPGYPEYEAEIDRRERGIPYHPEVIEWFKKTAQELGVEHNLT
ncbi:MAG: Ldh family oxidoreductase [Gammaproteobacteria bacterium]|nr:Ldh family oxidoreductase [Gammaproteobacteria bacterium]